MKKQKNEILETNWKYGGVKLSEREKEREREREKDENERDENKRDRQI